MVFDLDLIRKIYAELPGKVAAARQLLGRPLTLTEKILYAHLFGTLPGTPYTRGKDYVDFAPDRVAMQPPRKWHSFSSVPVGAKKWPFPLRCIAIT